MRTAVLILCVAAGACNLDAASTQSPLDPFEEAKHLHLADTNLIIELAAAEPDVRAPVAIAWDADGRMFVAEMTDYPSGPVSGRIRLVEDRDGDGRYEHSTVFATNIAFPNGVMAWKNGVLVTAAPDILFLADTNGDGVADVREKVLTGFTEGNQQLRVNGLYWGIDNWIYGCNGRSDGEVKWPDGTVAGSIRRHDFRFRPDIKQFEVVAGNSQFGMGHDDWGNRFPVFNAIPIRHVVIEERYLTNQPSLAGIDNVPSISPTNDGNRVFALTPPTLLIPQPVGFFTSACGPSIFRGTALPESYRGNYFVCEPVQNVVQRRVLKPNGSTFVAEYVDAPKEFLAASDPWFHGVFTATGPDGAFYIVDFYRDLVEHPHWVAPELRDKIDWRKGEEHGRIWRVRAKNAKLAKAENLTHASNAELVRSLENHNGWTRDTASRLLNERDARDSASLMEAKLRDATSPETRVHAFNVLASLGVLKPLHLIAALGDRDPRLREHGLRVAGQWETDYESGFGGAFTTRDEAIPAQNVETLARYLKNHAAFFANDPDARVRLQAACLFGALPDRSAGLARIGARPDLDRWQSIAILANTRTIEAHYLVSVLIGAQDNGTDEQRWLLEKLYSLAMSHKPPPVIDLSLLIAYSTASNRLGLAAVFVEALPLAKREKAYDSIGGERLVHDAMHFATNSTASLYTRLAAIRFLDATRLTSAVPALCFLLNRDQPESVQVATAKTLIEWDAPGPFSRQALERWPTVSKAARRQMVVSSLKNSTGPLALLDFVEPDLIAKAEIDPATRQTLQKHRDATVAARAKIIFADVISPDREAVVAKYRAALKLAGDRKHGAEIFEGTCAVCHQMQGVGAKVGPDLSGIGQHARETLLVDILDPSRQVLPDFAAYTATASSGDSFTGFIANESATTVTLRRSNEPDITLLRADLKSFTTSGKSLMPEGLEAGMSEQDMADLIEFLRRPDRTLFTQAK